MKFTDSIMTVVMLIIFIVMVSISSSYPPGARFMTFVVGFPAIALCLLQLFLDLREHRRAATGGRGEIAQMEAQATQLVGRPVHLNITMPVVGPEISPEEKLRREIIIWGYIIGLIGGILLFGFHAAVPIFLLTFLRFQAEAGWRMTIGLTVGASVFMYILFEHVFRMALHNGFVTEYLLERLG